MEIYRSPYEAYPFLSDTKENLQCDFELLTDEIASQIGLLASKVSDTFIHGELISICELVYHINPSLRTCVTITENEKIDLLAALERLTALCAENAHGFILPQGCETACLSHILRVQCKKLVRLLYRYYEDGEKLVSPLLLDVCNLLSGYFFYLALYFNQVSNNTEVMFNSRNYV